MLSRVRRDPRSEEADLALAVDALREEVRVLREVLDEIREAFEWQNNNAAEFPALVNDRGATWSLAGATLPPPPAAAELHQATSASGQEAPAQQQKLF